MIQINTHSSDYPHRDLMLVERLDEVKINVSAIASVPLGTQYLMALTTGLSERFGLHFSTNILFLTEHFPNQ